MSDIIRVDDISTAALKNSMSHNKKSFFNIDMNVEVNPTSFINDNELLDELFKEMSDDLKKKYAVNRPTMYVRDVREDRNILYPIMVDDNNHVINFKKESPAEGGRRRRSHRRRSHRRKSLRRRSHRRKSHRRRRH